MGESNLNNNYHQKALYMFLIMQFFTAFADNALFFTEIQLLKKNNSPGWEIPLLEDFFILGYIFLAPFMALISDKWSKRNVLMIATLIKLLGAVMLVLSFNPLLCCVIIGIGCAVFSPAKYGILPELVDPKHIIKANAYLEVVTIGAILIGVMAGGIISDHSTNISFSLIIALFTVSILINFFIYKMPAANPNQSWKPKETIREFIHSFKILYKNKKTRYSIINTSIFGASGSTLRYILVAWAPIALSLKGEEGPAMLNSIVAIGLAFGAYLASRYINMKNINKVSIPGVLLGIILIVLANITNLYTVSILLIILGLCGGFFLVPLNSVVQEEGKKHVGSGHAVAIQNLCEHALMLILVGIYSYLLKQNINIVNLAMILGVVMTVTIGATCYLNSKIKE